MFDVQKHSLTFELQETIIDSYQFFARVIDRPLDEHLLIVLTLACRIIGIVARSGRRLRGTVLDQLQSDAVVVWNWLSGHIFG